MTQNLLGSSRREVYSNAILSQEIGKKYQIDKLMQLGKEQKTNKQHRKCVELNKS